MGAGISSPTLIEIMIHKKKRHQKLTSKWKEKGSEGGEPCEVEEQIELGFRRRQDTRTGAERQARCTHAASDGATRAAPCPETATARA